jgi:polyisoprenoid-binding protein YceI
MLFLLFNGCASQRTASGEPSVSNNEVETATSMPFSENSTIFELLPAESEARFLIQEILRGEDKTVIGKTGGVSGQIAVDFDNPSASAVGPVRVNALTLETDNGFRNRAVHTRILLASIYEFVTFTATDISGLPDQITVGEPVQFQIEGDLTITAYTQPVIFEVTAVLVSESRLEGRATTVINRTDFDLVIPSAAGVAAVDNEVILEMDFVAGTVEE